MSKKIFKNKTKKVDPEKLKALIGKKQLQIASLMEIDDVDASTYIPLIAQIQQKPISTENIVKFGESLQAGKTKLTIESRRTGEAISLEACQHQETSITDRSLDIFAHLVIFELFEKRNSQIAELVASQLLVQSGYGMIILTKDVANALNAMQLDRVEAGKFSPNFEEIKQLIYSKALYSFSDLEKLN